MKKKLVFIFNTAQAEQFLKFSINLNKSEVLTVDSVVANRLTSQGYRVYNLLEVNSFEKRLSIWREKFQLVHDETNLIPSVNNYFEQSVQSRKIHLDYLYTFNLFWFTICEEFFKDYKCQSVVCFKTTSIREVIFCNIFKGLGQKLEINNTFKINQVQNIRQNLPYLGKETKHFWRFNKLLRPDRISSYRKKDFISKNFKFSGGEVVFFGPIVFPGTIKKGLQIAEDMGIHHEQLVFLLHPKLYSIDYSILKKLNICHVFLRSLLKNNIDRSIYLNQLHNLKLGYDQLSKKILPERLSGSLPLENVFAYEDIMFQKLEIEIHDLIEEFRPKKAILFNYTEALSRLACKTYKSKNIFVQGFNPELIDMIVGDNYGDVCTKKSECDPYFPDIIRSINRTIGSQICKISSTKVQPAVHESKFFEKKSFTAFKERKYNRSQLYEDLNVPDNSRFITFTTQQHDYSFEYVNILAKTFEKIKLQNKLANFYLIIKVHPKEFALTYKLFCKTGRYPFMRVLKKSCLSRIIRFSDAVVTAYSMTGIESMAAGTKIIQMDFNFEKLYPKSVFANLMTSVSTSDSLYRELNKVMKSQSTSDTEREKLSRDFYHRVNSVLK